MKLTLIMPFHGRHEWIKKASEFDFDGVDNIRVLCESREDTEAFHQNYPSSFRRVPGTVVVSHYPTPIALNGDYSVIPYSHKINFALDLATKESDLIAYLDNNSSPMVGKYRVMKEFMARTGVSGCYCTQFRLGLKKVTAYADLPVRDPYCVLNYTQVMHRSTDQRWPIDMKYARPDVADAIFLRSLDTTWYPVGGPCVLDVHEITTANIS